VTAATLTLADFLLARIAEEEATIRSREAPSSGATWDDWSYLSWVGNETLSLSPARALAECEAKRRIVTEMRKWGSSIETRFIMRCLAAPYADHPDFRPEWRP
jgi:hypothetical protein